MRAKHGKYWWKDPELLASKPRRVRATKRDFDAKRFEVLDGYKRGILDLVLRQPEGWEEALSLMRAEFFYMASRTTKRDLTAPVDPMVVLAWWAAHGEEYASEQIRPDAL